MNALPSPPTEPKTFKDLFDFYHNYVKLLYSVVQTENALPAEVLFEINAALDHISRHWIYGQNEAAVVSLAFGHLKRSCLDIFKIATREARRQYVELRRIDTSVIDNGDFDRNLQKLFAEIRQGATEARRLEGDSRTDLTGAIRAFDRWQPVFEACLRLENEFFHHPRLDWAKRRFWLRFAGTTLATVVLAFMGGIAGREFGPVIVQWVRGLL
jgi:hypothetical protein